jgi:hypothetical protein
VLRTQASKIASFTQGHVMTGQYLCQAPGRIDALRDAAQASPPRLLNGIHFLEVSADQRRLEVHFVHSLDLVPAAPLTIANVEIRGGVRVRDPAVTGLHWQDDVLTVEVATAGDFSRYVLRLVASAGVASPPVGIDPASPDQFTSRSIARAVRFRTDTACLRCSEGAGDRLPGARLRELPSRARPPQR